MARGTAEWEGNIIPARPPLQGRVVGARIAHTEELTPNPDYSPTKAQTSTTLKRRGGFGREGNSKRRTGN